MATLRSDLGAIRHRGPSWDHEREVWVCPPPTRQWRARVKMVWGEVFLGTFHTKDEAERAERRFREVRGITRGKQAA